MYASPYVGVTIPEAGIADFVFRQASAYPDKPAVIDGATHRVLTYAELVDAIRRTAAGLNRLGVRKGDVVAVYGPNSPDYITAFYAVTSLGAVITSLNPLHNAAELSYQLVDAGARLLIVTCEVTPALSRAAERKGVERVVALDDVRQGTSATGGRDLLSSVTLDPGADVASLTYSTAMSDVPMGVMLTHRNVVANLVQTSAVQPVDRADVLIGLTPFCHMYGMVTVNLGLQAGATIISVPQFSLQALLEAMDRYRVTTAYLIPAVIRTLAQHPLVHRYDLSRLRHITAVTAPLPKAVSRICTQRLGCSISQAYGLTHAVAFTHITSGASGKEPSVGLLVPSTECRIVDVASRRPVAGGSIGEVCVRGPQVMKGFHNYPEITSELLDAEGWLHTGDVGYCDAEGHLFVIDRSKKLARLCQLHRHDDKLLRAAVEDLAARQEATERLNLQAVLLNSVREAVVSTNLDHNVIFWNKGAEQLFGYPADEAIGKPLALLIASDGVTLLPVDSARTVGGQDTWSADAMRRRKDGSMLWTDVVVSLVRNASNDGVGYLAIYRDITELRRNQELVRESHERTRNLAARLMVVREHERSSIARELHDELGQALTRLNIDLQWLLQQLPQRLQSKRTHAMGGLVESTLRSVQQISSQLRPPILDDLGLEATIEWHVQEFSEWSGCRCETDLRLSSLPRDKDRDIAIYRIVQEALTNVARHARAELVRVRASVDAGEFVLEIEDDGIGIPDAKLQSPNSLGLIGMGERAEGLGGEVHIHGRPGGGTVVRLRLGAFEEQLWGAVDHDSVSHSR